MRLRLIGVFLGFWVASFAQSSKNQGYVYTVDITKVVKDKVHVELIAPPIATNDIIFYLPKIVPGTYDIALKVADASVPQRRLDSGYYMRQVKIEEI